MNTGCWYSLSESTIIAPYFNTSWYMSMDGREGGEGGGGRVGGRRGEGRREVQVEFTDSLTLVSPDLSFLQKTPSNWQR